MIELSVALASAEEIARSVGQMQKERLGRKDLRISRKSSGIDLVTDVDKKSEEAIIRFIKDRYPSHAILAEESGRSDNESDYVWVIDPLDGTTNYAQGLPVFSVSIGLTYRDEAVLGVVYVPVMDQSFTAIKGQGARLNGEPIQVAAKTELLESVLATGFPYDIADHKDNNVNYFSDLVVKARAIRRMGSAAYDLACVAAGKFDGFWEMGLNPWDITAGVLLVEEAGGQVIHFRSDRKISLIAGNAVLCQKVLAEIRKVDQQG
ncbi:inositol monophosphatase suhb [Lucifera butyrica]|uniref:Inositol-1-monophosphatase n=1 Tax=Lucifera butyrica TaxID=1351585 RepID=A0A498R935_9FIRM|nr:inositol monophosphatase family protein [Lucifera butyrica]VBB07440.1 inositol monophosphatase suhb [Lucifera butyrica]